MKQTTNRTTLQKHQHILYDNLSAMPEKGGFHVVDYSTGGGKTYVCLKWWCEEGHKHYKRMYFVLPQHKNIGSALSDFNSCNEAAHSQLTSLYLKSSNGISDFLAEPDSEQTLHQLLREVKRIVDNSTDVTKRQQEKLTRQYRKFESALNSLLPYCDRPLDKDNLEKVAQYEGTLRFELKCILLGCADLIESPETEEECIQNIQKALKAVPTLDKVYPIVHFHECQTIFLTAAKTAYKLDPIINPAFFLYNSRFVKDSLLVYDEFDTDYQELRNHLFNPKDEVLPKDLLSLFDELHTALVETKTKMTYNKQLDDIYKQFQAVADDYLQKVRSVYQEHELPYRKELYFTPIKKERPYFFRSLQSGTVFPSKVKQYEILANEELNALELVSRLKTEKAPADSATPADSQEDEQDYHEEGNTLPKIIRRILGLLRNFGATLGECSENLFKAHLKLVLQEESDDDSEDHGHVMPIQAAVDRETLYHFQLTKKGKNDLFRVVSKMLRNHTTKQTLPFIEQDTSVFNLGAYHLTLQEISELTNYYTVEWNEIKLTPERCFYNAIQQGNTLLALSATALIKSYSTNACMEYLRNQLGDQFHTLTPEQRIAFDEAYKETQPSEEERPVICNVLPELFLPKEEPNPFGRTLPDYPQFAELFGSEEWQEAHYLIAELHNKLKTCYKVENGERILFDEKTIHFYMNRYYQFLYTVRQFLDNDQCYSGLCFCNNLPKSTWLWKEDLLINLAGLLAGKSYSNPLIILRTDNFELSMEKFRSEVAKGEKRILLTSYKTTSIGMNLVHQAPEQQELTGHLPPYWEGNAQKAREKDIDLLMFQDVSNHIMQQKVLTDSQENEEDPEPSALNHIYYLMVMHYTGHISTGRLRTLIQLICTRNFRGVRKDDVDFYLDIQMNKLFVLKQAVGRGCRRTIKGKATYIYIAPELVEAIRLAPKDQSYGVEFRALMDFVQPMPPTVNIQEMMAKRQKKFQLNTANKAQDLYRNELYRSINYYHESAEKETDIETQVAQAAIEKKRQLIMCHPTYEELPGDPVAAQLYIRFDEPVTSYAYKAGEKGLDGAIQEIDTQNTDATPSLVNEERTYLPDLVRNPVVRAHFEANQIPTTWAPGQYILPPYLLLNVYKGCIGEEALKAILTMLFPDDQFVPYKGSLYEVADLHAVKRQIAFDAKNYGTITGYDSQNDHSGNMRFKAAKLGCTVIFIQLVGVRRDDVVEKIDDHLYAIPGIIDSETGQLKDDAIHFLREIYKQAPPVTESTDTNNPNKE